MLWLDDIRLGLLPGSMKKVPLISRGPGKRVVCTQVRLLIEDEEFSKPE